LAALAIFAVLACGCEPPVICGHPLLAMTEENIILAAAAAAPGQDESRYFLFTASRGDLARWRRDGPFAGKPVGLAATPAGAEMILENGALLRLAVMPGAPSHAIPCHVPGKLASAARIAGQWYAVSITGSVQLLLYKVDTDKEEWQPAAPALAVIGFPRQLRLISWREHPLLLWRPDIGGQMDLELQLAVWENGDWHHLPPPPPLRGHFAALDRDGALLLARDKMAPPPSAVVCQLFENGDWRALASLPTAEAGALSRGTGAAIALLADGFLFVHADTAGLRVSQAEEKPTWRWCTEVEIWKHGPAATTTLLLFLLIIAGGAALLFLTRALRRSLQNKSRQLAAEAIGGFASPLDRSLAFAVDAFLLIPLPLAFRWTSSDTTPLLRIPDQDHLAFYWLWMTGISLYLAIAEYATGSSAGKRLLGLRVRSAAGGRPTLRQAVLRNLGRAFDFWPVAIWGVHMPYLVGLLLISFMPRRQRIGDLLANTVVRSHAPLSQREIVLASSSPRRRMLLANLNIPFRVEIPAIEESLGSDQSGEEVVLALAQRKAETVSQRLRGGELVIAADTIVVYGSRLIGKPRDRKEAMDILRLLSGQTHRVLTAIAIVDRATGERQARIAVSEVEMRPLSEDEIAAYVASGEADNKAGAYAVQETGDRFIRQIRGSVSNVIGLPLELLAEMLDEIAN